MSFLKMPAPIPINRNTSQMESFGSPRTSGLTPKQANFLVGSASYKEPMAISFGKDVSEIMDYSISRFSTSTESDITVAPSSARLESTFCRNFTCCGQKLDDLHDLLQHYEECHVKFEDDEMPAMIADDDIESSASSSETASQPASPRTATVPSSAAAGSSSAASAVASGTSVAAHQKAKPHLQTADSFEATSAFDTAVMRSPSLSKGKKRSFGQYATNSNGSSSAIHQSLRRALIDGGVGRRTPGQPQIYAPNSPFSTPGSSIPGTPSCDSENGDFFGNGVNPSAFSALSIRANGAEEHHLPSCAPPNLFFPASGTSTAGGQPPAKRERTASANVPITAINIENALKASSSCVDKPYKCPAPGCDKAYKQMNGLKYHRLHGHCNQNNLPIQTQAAQATAHLPTVAINTNVAGAKATSQSQASGSWAPSPLASKASTSPAPAPSAMQSAAPAAGTTSGAIAPSGSNDVAAEDASLANMTTPPSMPPSPISNPIVASPPPPSTTSSAAPAASGGIPLSDRLYICQVGACGKRYKNLNGLRYHYLHSGQHGLLGMQLLQSGGGSSAKVDATGRAPVSTSTLSSEEIAAAAQAAQAAQEQMQAAAAKSAAATAASAAAAANNGPNALGNNGQA
ncbi:Transcription factor sfp1 [Thecaphora frezii]